MKLFVVLYGDHRHRYITLYKNYVLHCAFFDNSFDRRGIVVSAV